MADGSKTYKFMAAEPSAIIHPKTMFAMEGSENNPENVKATPEYDINVTLPSSTLSTIQKVASINSLPDYGLITEDGEIFFTALDKKSDSTDIAKEPVGSSNVNFKMYFKSENLKLIDGDYSVSVSRNAISTFRHNTRPIQYWITLESDSQYDI